MKSKWVLFFIPALFIYIFFNRFNDWKKSIFFWDKYGYYSYLPATFIYHDVAHLSFYPETIKRYNLVDDGWYATSEVKATGNRINKYAIGTSVLELPFFLAAHAGTTISQNENYPADGFSLPYQIGMAVCFLFWVFVGLYYLRKFLKAYFSDGVVAVTLICIALGTNLYYYTAIDAGMSHPMSFMLFCLVLYVTDAWYKTYKPKYLYALALALGLITIVRPTNVAVAILPLLWGVNSLRGLNERLRLFVSCWKQLIIAAIIFITVLSIQMAYWKYVTGQWVYYSYGEEYFNFRHPRILKGLFGFRKGWFIYTPMAFIAALGFFPLWKQYKKLAPAVLLYMLVAVYITFSWYKYWYGGSFGCRAMIETLAVLSLPLASLLEYMAGKAFFMRTLTYIIITFFIALNIFQSYQYMTGALAIDAMTFKYYCRVFGKLTANEEDKKFLMTAEEQYKESLESQQ